MKNTTYNSLTELLHYYTIIGYRPAKKGELIITTPNMMTGSNENVLSVNKCSTNMKYIYSRIVKENAR
jgi:hypothetical protein